MDKPVVLTGLRANNVLHLGNYLGALQPMIDFAHEAADKYQINLFVPDLHSFTTPIDHQRLYESILATVQSYIALGLPIDHENVYVYRQSQISAHSELAWILSCFTSFGEMRRMTQFKDKADSLQQENISVGLFNYPILMAADILLYNATYVPVGDDQTQHLEFTRDIAERMNKRFESDLFTVPKNVKEQHTFFGKDQGLRIRDLVDPRKKMSKSANSEKGVIFLSDAPEVARQKIMSATTDSLENIQYDYEAQPGISNLLDILSLFGGDKDSFIGQQQYGPLKNAVADVVANFLHDFQAKAKAVSISDIDNVLLGCEQSVRATAQSTLARVQTVTGLRQNST